MTHRHGSHRLRHGRRSLPGQHYLITTTCYRRKPLLLNPAAAEVLIGELRNLDAAGQLALDAAMIMPDHLHFVASIDSIPLDKLMQGLKGRTAYRLNRLLFRRGPVWQDQYHDHALRQDESLAETIQYCLHNPVRAGLVQDFHDYPYWYCRYPV